MSLKRTGQALALSALAVACLSSASIARAGETTTQFQGVKVTAGAATHERRGAVDTLTWSDDFRIPDSPAPHWQVVDSKGRVYLLQRLKIKGDKENRTIALPAYVGDVAKVQIYCAWAEALLGEATFSRAVVTAAGNRETASK